MGEGNDKCVHLCTNCVEYEGRGSAAAALFCTNVVFGIQFDFGISFVSVHEICIYLKDYACQS